jgi:hygromycin-B 7''-O-kinase
MDRMPGESLETAWDKVDAASRDGLASRLGEAMAALHALPYPDLEDWFPEDWDEFVEQQRAGCVARHRGLGLAPAWAEQIPPFLDSVELPDSPLVLVHTEIMRQHLLVAQTDRGWEFTGLFDFEPAMRGVAEYEFVAVSVFGSEGDARFLGRALRAYGHPGPDEAFRRRMMAWTLLHYYSNVRKYLDHLPKPEEPTLESLADRWYATE